MKRLPISIIIPTLNEARYLPKLLLSIERQTAQPQEIIISDAFSIDKTREVAEAFGAKVVDGGLPAKARNEAAKKAKGEILLFLDADVVLPPGFLEKTYFEMKERHLDVASCYVQPVSKLRIDKVMHEIVNYYLKLTTKFNPHIPGFCIFVKTKVHHKIKGFDESLYLAEDHDYVQRAQRRGKFAYLTCYKIPVSIRRLAEEGRIKIALKYIAIELHLLFIGKIKTDTLFKYEFGKHFKM